MGLFFHLFSYLAKKSEVVCSKDFYFKKLAQYIFCNYFLIPFFHFSFFVCVCVDPINGYKLQKIFTNYSRRFLLYIKKNRGIDTKTEGNIIHAKKNKN